MIRRIYIAQDGRDGPIKIGMSSNVITRTRALSKKMIILAVLDGGRREEMALHKRFAHLSIGGEWFNPGPDLLAFIKLHPSPATALKYMPGYEKGVAYRIATESPAKMNWTKMAMVMQRPPFFAKGSEEEIEAALQDAARQ